MKFSSAIVLLAFVATSLAKKDCAIPCLYNVGPKVCATDGHEYRLFTDDCLLKLQNCYDDNKWQLTRIAQCAEPSEQLSAERKNCMTPCTKDFTPVCGFDGEHYRIFDNDCVMRNQHCEDNHEWKRAQMVDCEKRSESTVKNCEKPCARDYTPVCGSDGAHYKMFNNECMMQNQHCQDGHAWTLTRMSDCMMRTEPLETKTSCETPCTRDLRPVCGFDGEHHRVFNNECMMKNEHCEDGHKWSRTTMSECLVPINADAENCFKPCTREYMPVCGFDGRAYKFFDNHCMMLNQHCEDGHKWIESKMDNCQQPTEALIQTDVDCVVACPAIYLPVCGFDGKEYKEFANECMMRGSDCHRQNKFHKVAMSFCDQSNKQQEVLAVDADCVFACPEIYLPVCGFDGKEYKQFSNDCMMKGSNCHRQNKFQKVAMSFCDASSTKQLNTVVAAESDDLKPNCVYACTFDYLPVCGFDGREHRVFSNECDMIGGGCRRNHWQKVSMADCTAQLEVAAESDDLEPNCKYACPDIYLPVCGFDGKERKIFPSECDMVGGGCRRNHWQKVPMMHCTARSEVLAVQEEDCPVVCDEVYAPVCAFDGERHKVFANHCMFVAGNCHDSQKWKLTRLNDCGDVFDIHHM